MMDSNASDHGVDGAALAKLLPELATLAVVAALTLDVVPPWLGVPAEDTVTWLVAVEAVMLMLMFSLVDVATRLRRPPPWWLGIAIAVGLLAVQPNMIGMLVAGWQLGLWVFLPLLWSLLERFRELWTLPNVGLVEKYRRRALSNGRVATAVIVGGLFITLLLGNAVLLDDEFDPELVIHAYGLLLLALFYLISAYDAWRVHRPAFAQKPRSLWPFLDIGETDRLDPL